MVLWIILLCKILKTLLFWISGFNYDILSTLDLTHLTILLGYAVKGYVIKNCWSVYYKKTFGTLLLLYCQNCSHVHM